MNVIRNALHLTAPLESFCITHNIYDVISDYTVDSYHVLYYKFCLKYVHHLNIFRNETPHCPREFSAPRRAEGQTFWSFLSSSLFISLIITLGLINVNIYCVSVICIPPLFFCPFHPSSIFLFISLITRIGLIVFDHLTCV